MGCTTSKEAVVSPSKITKSKEGIVPSERNKGSKEKTLPSPKPIQEATVVPEDFTHNDVDMYTRVDNHARKAPSSLKNSVSDLVAYLSLPSKQPKMVARAIFAWIAENIKYDTEGYFGKTAMAPSDAESVIKNGRSVCEGYANVMELLCREASIPVKKISGFAKGLSYSAESPFTTAADTNHAWNAIQLDKKWYLVDSTWGTGHVERRSMHFTKKFEDFYFLTEPKHFVYSHFPYMGGDMEESRKWQLLAQPVTLDEFNKLVKVRPEAFNLGVQPVSHKEGVIRMKQEVELSFRCTGKGDVSYSTRLMYKEGNMLYEKPRYVFGQNENDLFKVRIRPHQTGTFQLTVFGRRADEEGTYPGIFEYVVICEKAHDKVVEYPYTYTQAQVDRCILKTPLQYKLNQNTLVEFHITSPYLNRVMINKTFLEKSGTSFKGAVKTGNKGEMLSVYGSRNTAGSLSGLYRFEVV